MSTIGSTKQLLGLPPCSPLPSSEDYNTDPPSPTRAEAGEEVNGPWDIEGITEHVSKFGTDHIWGLIDEESNEDGSNYSPNGSE